MTRPAVIDPTDAEIATVNDDEAFLNVFASIAKPRENGPPSSRKKERKARENKAAKMVDGRKLRAKGRTVQINFKAKPSIREALNAILEAEGITIADFMERAIEAAQASRSN